ncbi:TIGR03013 family XrtA/PEP-CTERM system glycosyltransferase [Granulosicoccus sp. 3-233]|uniref:TIGR03013 family XrtA/PEP-CTERM system glycosyltransferase n=1 Tax=Granulosicoccus sp. 3-233 TaxID=3417969 RepID=UPI003D32A421
MGTFKFFKMHLRVPFLLLALMEFCICVAAVFVAVYVRFDGSQITEIESIRSPIATSMLFGLVMPVTMMAMGLYQSRFRGGILGVFLRSVIGFACGAAILALLYYLIPHLYLGRGVFGLAILIAFFMVGTIRPMFFYYVDKDILKIRVLVLGAGDKAASINRRLRRRVDRRGFRIVGYVKLDTDPRVAVDSVHVVDLNGRSLLEFAIENNVDEVVVAADERRSGLPLEELLDCKLHGLDVIDLLSFFEREQGKLPLDILRPDWLIYSDGFERGAVRDVSKRAFDIVASMLIIAITWPFMLLGMLAIKIEDGWSAPVLYRQTRTGFLGKPFGVLKFRSMTVNAERDGVAQWATANDSRVTRVGQFIRKTRIDELPQILNVLKGDMSFVGPRPERPQFVEQLSEVIPYYRERHAVKPGITGWAQVCYPYGASTEDSVQKQEFDLYYIKNHTIFLDMLILCQTAEVVLFGKGAR